MHLLAFNMSKIDMSLFVEIDKLDGNFEYASQNG